MITPNEGRTCKCGAPTLMNCPHCVTCNNKRVWKEEYHEMVGRHIEAADRLPFDGDVNDADYATEAMYQASEQAEQIAQAS